MKLHKKNMIQSMVKAIVVCAIILATSSTCATDKSSISPGNDQPARRLFIIGHRGAAGLAPENTLAAFSKACELGVDAVELDVFLSADNTLVVHHDYTLKPETTRSADGEWLSRPGPAMYPCW